MADDLTGTLTVTPQTPTLSDQAAKLGQPSPVMKALEPPIDATQIPVSPFTNQYIDPNPEAARQQVEAEETTRRAAGRPDLGEQITATPYSKEQEAAHQRRAEKVTQWLTTGSRKMPIPWGGPGSPKNVGEALDAANEYLNNPAVPKTHMQAFMAGAAADTAKTLNDMFLSPLGLAASGLGVTEAVTLAKAGQLGGDAAKLAQEYHAMRAAGASEAELLDVENKIRQSIASASRAQKIAVAGRKVGVGAAVGFGAQGAAGVAKGIEEKNLPEVLQGAAGLALGGAAAAGAVSGGGPEAQVKADTAARARAAVEGSDVAATRVQQVGEPPKQLPEHVTFDSVGGREVNAPAKITTDNLGVKWAENDQGVRVSIPKNVPEEQVQEYAAQQLATQTKAQAEIKDRVAGEDEVPAHITFNTLGGKEVKAPAASEPTIEHREGVSTFGSGSEAPQKMNQVRLMQNGKEMGRANYTMSGNTASIKGVHVDPNLRGRGYAQQMYLRAADEARNAGATSLTSDLQGTTTMDAARVWDKLAAKGHPVEKVPSKAGSPGYKMDLTKPAPETAISSRLETNKTPIPEGSQFVAATPEEHRTELDKNPQAATLSDKTVEQLRDHKIFKLQTPQGQETGIQYHITPEGEAGGFVNNGPYRNATAAMIQHASAHGATHRTAWDIAGKLPTLYEKGGMKSTGVEPYNVSIHGEPSARLKSAWKAAGWKEGDVYPGIRHLAFSPESPDWHQNAGRAAGIDESGGINSRTGKSDTTRVGTEILPELRQSLDHAPTAEDFKKFYEQHKEIFDKHPELRVGWDTNSAVKGGHEINVGAVGPNAAAVAKKLDLQFAFDIAKGENIPTGGTGLRTSFPDYPLEQRLAELGKSAEAGAEIPSRLEASKKGTDQPTLPLSRFKVIGGEPEDFEEAVKNTPFASINDRGLTVNLTRFQKPEQKGEQAGRGGVFYLGSEGGTSYYKQAARFIPGSADAPRTVYGGAEEMRGRTTFQNPLIVKGGFGGIIQAKAIAELIGKETTRDRIYKNAVDTIQNAQRQNKDVVESIAAFLEQNGGDSQRAYDIYASSKSNQQRGTAIYDNILGQKAKDAGHDAIIGYYKKPGGGYQLSEIFDLTAQTYPEKTYPKGATTPLMKNPLTLEGTGEGGRTTIFDFATAINQWAQAGLKPKKEIAVALDRARAEMTYQLANDNSGLNRYKSDVGDAVKHLQANGFPELEKPLQDKLFRVLWGITSYGVDPDVNLTSAAEAWKQYKKTGIIPLTADGKTNWPGYSGIKGSITLLNKLLDEKGEQGTIDWLMAKHPVSEIRDQKLKTHTVHGVAGKAEDEKYGAFIFGPKGGPYVLSLQGITDHTTVDVWGSRMIRRWTGTLTPESMDQPVTAAEAEKFHGIVENIGKEFRLDTSDAQAVLWGYEHDLYEAHGVGEAAKSYKGAAEKYVEKSKAGTTRDFITEQSSLFRERYGEKVQKAEGGGKSAPAKQSPRSRSEGLKAGLAQLAEPAQPVADEGDTSFEFGANVKPDLTTALGKLKNPSKP